MGQEDFQTLLNFFKILGNENRLKLVGILANGDYTVRELATMLKVKEPTVSEHLMALKQLDLVTVRPEGNFRIYSFNPSALRLMNKEVFSRENLASLADDVVEDSERKVLQTFIKEDRLVSFPASEKKYLVILRWLTNQFEEGVQYPEKQVNEILKRHNEDYATLRRDLIDFGFMKREKGIYWRVTPSAEQRVQEP
jgi:hypothetical protein